MIREDIQYTLNYDVLRIGRSDNGESSFAGEGLHGDGGSEGKVVLDNKSHNILPTPTGGCFALQLFVGECVHPGGARTESAFELDRWGWVGRLATSMFG
jgi:hypothetical protein